MTVVFDHLFDAIGSECTGVTCAFFVPSLKRLVVKEVRAPERSLEVRLSVGAAKVMTARADFADRIHRLAVFGHIDAASQTMQSAELISVHNELFKVRNQTTFEPTTSVKHEVHASHEAHVQRVRSFICCLSVRQFRTTERTSRTIRQVQTTCELTSTVGDQSGLRCTKGRSARPHVDRGHERTKDHWRAFADQLAVSHACQNFGQNLSQRASNRNRSHSAANDERRDDASLVVASVNFECTHHDAVESHRRVDVDERGHHGVFLNELFAEQDFTHLNRILRTARFGHRTHERFVRQGHVRQKHVEVTLVHRNIGRFANGAA